MRARIPRLMVAAFHSGGGKTTLTCAILQALLNKGLTPAAFKCGPDYIDPMFHSEVMGVEARNLDLFLLPEDICRFLLVKSARSAPIAILEGAMGYYDGLGANSSTASSYHLAQVTNTPVILIVDSKGSSLSLAALIKGFAQFRPDSGIKGVILNNLSPGMYPLYKEMIEAETGMKVLGYFPHLKECSLASRHLGLITAAEVHDLQQKIQILGQQAEKTIDLELLLGIAHEAEEIECENYPVENQAAVTIAVAKDKAFCFYYQDSLELLEEMGAKIRYFSPLQDKELPECDGLILGGGYPEVYGRSLAENRDMLASLREALEREIPCLAECGGFMYLLDEITDQEGNPHRMIGALKGRAFMTEKLNRFGYLTLTARNNNLLAKEGESINAHEFHYSDTTSNGSDFIARKPTRSTESACIHGTDHLFAGYPHLHLWGNREFAVRFVRKCLQYKSFGTEE